MGVEHAPEKAWRIAEIFGPTIQGEGRHAGMPCHFIRFGGCDFRCKWCDSTHAVLPELVAQLPKMNSAEILQAVKALPKGPNWVVLSGGNPALFELTLPVAMLMDAGYSVMVETQGTVYSNWLDHVNEVCVSPKPPSAGTWTSPFTLNNFINQFSDNVDLNRTMYFKIVIYEDQDYGYAQEIHGRFPYLQMYLSVCTHDPYMPTVGNPDPDPRGWYKPNVAKIRKTVGDDFRKLAERVANDPRMRDVCVLPQLHVIAWGIERGH